MINRNLNIAVYAVMALCVMAGRRSGQTAHSRARAPWHPLAPTIVLASMVALTLADLMDPESGRPALLAGALVVGGGVLYAVYVEAGIRHGGRATGQTRLSLSLGQRAASLKLR